ncbi:hypothetical protein K443DRAFT_14553, partial [Laccaria amethystina LaAM-08-1]
ALGNAINIGDANEVWEGMDVFTEGLAQKPTKGKIHFYISNLNPPDVDLTKSSFIANVHDINKCETIQDVIGRSSQDYSPIRHKFAKFSVSLPGFAGRLGSSIGSHSVSAFSGSRTGSCISAGRSPSTLPAVEQGSSSGHWFIGKDKISPVLQKRPIEELNINANFTNLSATGLRFAWGRFLECTAALAQAKEMVEAGSWPADIPPFTEWM